MKYSLWLAVWLNDFVRPVAKPKTFAAYSGMVKNHISPRLGGMEAEEVDAPAVQSFISQMSANGNANTGKPLSPATVGLAITVIKLSLGCARSLGLVKGEACGGVIRPKVRGKKVDCFTRREQRLIERAVLSGGRPAHMGVVICLYTGLRIGELLALTWADIDFSSRRLYVGKTCRDGYCNGRYIRQTNSPKTPSSERYIPLSGKLCALLKGMKKVSRSEYVISHGARPVPVRSYQRTFERLLVRLGIPRRGFHALRHTFATRAAESGMDAAVLAEILGHSSPVITLGRYVHPSESHKIKCMNRLAEGISPTTP